MKRAFKKSMISLSVMFALSALFLSFTRPFGGDSFEIYLNNKLVVQQYVAMEKSVKTISLVQGNYDDQLEVIYSHCGVVGKSRSIFLKNGADETVKKWQFADAAGNEKRMACNVKDILGLKKNGTGAFKLYYSSHELPGGRLLANIVIEKTTRSGR